MRKIYSNDALLRYKDTDIPPLRTKQDIDGTLAAWGVKEIYWKFDPKFEDTEIFVGFKVDEEIDGVPVTIPVKIMCPIIWDPANPRSRTHREEQINWRISMRIMYHYVYNTLNLAYAMQSQRFIAFLPYVRTGEKTILRDRILNSVKQGELTFQERKAIPSGETPQPGEGPNGQNPSRVTDVQARVGE